MDPYTLATMTLPELLKEQQRVTQVQARAFSESGCRYAKEIERQIRARFGITEQDYEKFSDKTTTEIIGNHPALK